MASLAEHPLFMTEAEAAVGNERLEALQHLLYEEPPRDIADRCRHQGNEQLKSGRLFYTRAVGYYTQGIEAECDDAKLNSILYANRAHVQLLKGNLRSAMQDCDKAIGLDPTNTKAYYRGAKASIALRKWAEAAKYARNGLDQEGGNEDLQKLLGVATSRLDEVNAKAAGAQAAAMKEEEKRQATKEAMESRGLMVCGMDQIGHAAEEMRRARAYVDDEGALHWPILIMYPEHSQSDFILEASENDLLGDHLGEVLAEPPPWVNGEEYTLEKIVCYIPTFARPPTLVGLDQWKKQKATRDRAQWVEVDLADTLAEIVAHPEHVIVGCPVVHVMVRDSKYHQKFLKTQP